MDDENFIGYIGDYRVHDSRIKEIQLDEDNDASLEIIAHDCIIQ